MKIILASQSPRRREILAKLVDSFEVCPSDADEGLPHGMAPDAAVKLLAERKATAVFEANRDCCVIGSDTVVVIDGQILGKPKDRADEIRMLTLLSGRTHCVYTGMAIVTPRDTKLSCTITEVDFYPLTQEEIERYADSAEPYDKAGGYGIQDRGCVFVSGISGDYFNVMGLPAAVLYRQLREMKILPTVGNR